MAEPNPFETHYAEYDAWFDRNPNVYESELLAIRELLPPPGDWIEIGVGSGRFASVLGIPVGIEPAEGIATLARARGVGVVKGKAECLPLRDATVDAAFLITTLCFVDDIDRTFYEVARVLRAGGRAIVAFVPKDSRFGELYRENATGSSAAPRCTRSGGCSTRSRRPAWRSSGPCRPSPDRRSGRTIGSSRRPKGTRTARSSSSWRSTGERRAGTRLLFLTSLRRVS